MACNHHFRVDLGYAEEMGFRSHLFFDEFETSSGGFNSLSRSHGRDHPYVSDVVDTLSDQFSSLSLLRPKPRPSPTLPSSLQSLRPNGLKSHQRMYGERPKREPYYELHLSRLRKNEQDRAMVLRRQEERLYKRGLVHRNGNALSESVGTGVFHPLQRPTTNSVKNQNQSNRNQSEKELLSKIKRGVMTTTRQEQQEMDECHYHLPPDMDFSKDWTF